MTELQPCKSRPGAILREAREASGRSREALARDVDVSLSTINRLELHDQLPRFAVLAAICKLLGLSLDHLAAVLTGEPQAVA